MNENIVLSVENIEKYIFELCQWDETHKPSFLPTMKQKLREIEPRWHLDGFGPFLFLVDIREKFPRIELDEWRKLFDMLKGNASFALLTLQVNQRCR